MRGVDVPMPQKYSLVITGPGLTLLASTDRGCPQAEPSPVASPSAAPPSPVASSSTAPSNDPQPAANAVDGVPMTTFQVSIGLLVPAVIIGALAAAYFWRRSAGGKSEADAARTPLIFAENRGSFLSL